MDDVKMDMGAMAVAVLVRWRRIAFITFVLLVATYAILLFVPKVYESSADILVESRQSAFTRAANEVLPSSGVADETAISSQIELIKSRGTLERVIEAENLVDEPEFNGSKKFSPLSFIFRLLGRSSSASSLNEIVLGNVAENLTVVQERDSHVISILFRSTSPELAARVANAIANTHVQRRGELYLADTAEATQWLLVEIEKLRTRVAEAEAKVAAYRVDNDLFVGANETSLLDQQLSDLSTQISAAQERENSARSRAALIRGLLEAGQPIDSVPDVRQSVVVQQLSEEKARLQGNRAQRLATLLPNHPDVLALSAQIAEIDKQILAEGRQVADALEAEAKIEANLESSLRDELTRLKVEASTATKGSVMLNELEREAKAQRDLLETYLLRYRDAASRTESNSALPDVRVVSIAAAAISPASPKKSLILAAVLIVSLMLQLGHILFVELVSGRALTDGSGASLRPAQAREFEASVGATRAIANATALESASDEQYAPEKQQKADDEISHQTLGDIAARIAANGHGLVLVGTLGSPQDSRIMTENLTADLVAKGRSAVEVDAGSRRVTSDAGISDLCAGSANFGDVVHRGRRSDFALVPWGRQPVINFGSKRLFTLIEALSDIFEIVIIDIGRVGLSSSLPAFVGNDGLVILGAAPDADQAQIEHACQDIEAIGFDNIQVAHIDFGQVKVA